MNLNKVSEGIHYNLIPNDDPNSQAWYVRIEEGDFVETVIRYGAISFNDEQECLNFNFEIVSTPDSTLSTTSANLQEHVGLILEDILEKAIAENALVTEERT